MAFPKYDINIRRREYLRPLTKTLFEVQSTLVYAHCRKHLCQMTLEIRKQLFGRYVLSSLFLYTLVNIRLPYPQLDHSSLMFHGEGFGPEMRLTYAWLSLCELTLTRKS